ncbi:hypothetical protein HGB07_03720 [Candidatus Roizmanbacteria bacterium]|nr:hypothetical protein [Candidatus Roizmanbacteria bacterium]
MIKPKIIRKIESAPVFDDNFPEILDVIYSIDRIRFISLNYVKELKGSIPEKLLMQNCTPDGRSIVSRHNSKKARQWGYRSILTASACNDDFFEIIRCCDPGILSHIQIACDLMFATMEEAEEYGRWHDKNVERLYNRSQFMINTTKYQGREGKDGEKKPNYDRSYHRISKLTGMPCYHIEFTLEGSTIIKRTLQIKDHCGLTTAEEMYKMLENRYLRVKGTGLKRGRRYGSEYIQVSQYNRIAERLKSAKNIKCNDINM